MAGLARDPGRCRVAVRVPPRHPDRARRAARSRRGARRLRRARARPTTDRHVRVLLVLDTNTWHAYNTWGGRSLYTGGKKVSFARPFGRGILCRPEVDRDDRKARPTRWGEEPDVDGAIFQAYRTEHAYPSAIGSTGWFTHGRRFVEWAERAGYEFDYAVSSDLDQDPQRPRRLPTSSCQRRSRRVLVGGPARRRSRITSGAAATSPASPATRCSGRSASSSADGRHERWSVTSTRRTTPTRSSPPASPSR